MPWNVSNWLDQQPEELDLYTLLGRPRFDSDRQAILQAIRDANRELHPYQNHSDAKIARHAQNWQRAVARASEAFHDPARLAERHRELIDRLHESASAKFGALDANSAELSRWLNAEQNVHGAGV